MNLSEPSRTAPTHPRPAVSVPTNETMMLSAPGVRPPSFPISVVYTQTSCLAIQAQRSAERISDLQRRAFTPEFYRGTSILASFFSKLEEVAEEKGSSIEDKLDDLAPRVHDFLLSNDPLSTPPEIDLEPVPEWNDEDELFNDDA
jgi:hypothetical protein